MLRERFDKRTGFRVKPGMIVLSDTHRLPLPHWILPAVKEAPLVELANEVATPLGNYRLLLKGDARSVNRTLSAVATRVS